MTDKIAKQDTSALALDGYLDYDLDAAEEEASRMAEEADAEAKVFFKHPGGERALRLVPPHRTWLEWFQARNMKPTPFFVLWKHFYEDPNNPGRYISLPCPQKMGHGPCLICAQVSRLKLSGDPLDAEMADDMEARHVALVNVIDRDELSAGVLIWEMSYPYKRWKGKSMYEKVRALMRGRARRDIVTPGPNGYDIIITKTGQGRTGTSYTLSAAGEPCALHEDPAVAMTFINEQHDLREYVMPPTPEQMAAILAGDDEALKSYRNGGGRSQAAAPRGGLPPADEDPAHTDRPSRADDYVDVGRAGMDEDDDLDF